MIVEKIIQTYRFEAEEFSQDIFRASLIGKCPRRLGFQRLGLVGHPQIRAYLTFEIGDLIHGILRDRIRDAIRNGLFDEFVSFKFEDEEKIEIKLKLSDEITIIGHPDGIYEKKNGIKGVIEFKSASNYMFRRALSGDLDPDYLYQAAVYLKGGDFDEFIWIFYRKETSHLLEILVSPLIDTLQVMENKDKHFFLVETPFNINFDSIIEKYNKILSCNRVEDIINTFPPAIQVGVCHNCGGTGLKEYGKCRVCKGFGRLNPPYEITYPCSYCPYYLICFPEAVLEFTDDNKPKIKIGG